MAATMMEKAGSWSFILGILVAFALGIVGTLNAALVYVLLVLGLIVGLLNVSDREIMPFLVATVALVVSGSAVAAIEQVPRVIDNILVNITIFVVPAAVIASLKAIYELASTR